MFIFGDDNSNNEDNFLGRTSCRGTTIIAHLSENVNLVVINIDKLRRANRSEKALRRAKNANRRHTLGDRNSCLGDRKSCNAYSGGQMANPPPRRRSPFSRVFHRNFSGFNKRSEGALKISQYTVKTNPFMLALFSSALFPVDFKPLLEVNGR